ncbi:MAG: shikimate dehydrogenase [Clostridia bacterium]|nr:shikimate dehydrogenase [Clostridia bacterium]
MEYGCIGEKLGHSFSKEIHAKLFDYKYELLELRPEELPAFMGAKKFKAINVTIPYKKDVMPFLDEISPRARAIGAVNTIVNKNGKLYGYNTDFGGMKALIEHNGIEIKGKKVLVLGSGGTSLTAFAVAKEMGADTILKVSRTPKDGFITYIEAENQHSDAEVIINTTPCGMYPNIGVSPINLESFKKLSGVVDAIYNPLKSQLVANARKRGIKAAGGLYMLVAQGVFAAEKFTDSTIPEEKILKVYNGILKDKGNIVLIGMPTSGKSTIGAILAQELEMDFVDTDKLITEREKREIPEIIATEGESGFRRIEAEVIAEAAARQNTVIATGGGAILNSKNTEMLSLNGRIYFLDRPLENLAVTADRPLSNDREKLNRLYRERYDIYCKSADVIIKCVQEIRTNVNMIKDDFLKCEF